MKYRYLIIDDFGDEDIQGTNDEAKANAFLVNGEHTVIDCQLGKVFIDDEVLDIEEC